MANPEELATYPSATEGFRNHHGEFFKYDPNVAELPESLPTHGNPPHKPYESVSGRIAACLVMLMKLMLTFLAVCSLCQLTLLLILPVAAFDSSL